MKQCAKQGFSEAKCVYVEQPTLYKESTRWEHPSFSINSVLALPTKVMQVLNNFGCATICERTFFLHQKNYLQLSISTVWQTHQEAILQELRREKRALILGGDSRADSPGHSAGLNHVRVVSLYLIDYAINIFCFNF